MKIEDLLSPDRVAALADPTANIDWQGVRRTLLELVGLDLAGEHESGLHWDTLAAMQRDAVVGAACRVLALLEPEEPDGAAVALALALLGLGLCGLLRDPVKAQELWDQRVRSANLERAAREHALDRLGKKAILSAVQICLEDVRIYCNTEAEVLGEFHRRWPMLPVSALQARESLTWPDRYEHPPLPRVPHEEVGNTG